MSVESDLNEQNISIKIIWSQLHYYGYYMKNIFSQMYIFIHFLWWFYLFITWWEQNTSQIFFSITSGKFTHSQ